VEKEQNNTWGSPHTLPPRLLLGSGTVRFDTGRAADPGVAITGLRQSDNATPRGQRKNSDKLRAENEGRHIPLEQNNMLTRYIHIMTGLNTAPKTEAPSTPDCPEGIHHKKVSVMG